MKFGATLSRRSVPQWRTHDLDYDEIKLLIKEQTASPEGCSREFEQRLLTVLDSELERVCIPFSPVSPLTSPQIDEFVRCKAGEIERRLSACQRTVKSLSREPPGETTDSSDATKLSPLKKLVKIEAEIDRYLLPLCFAGSKYVLIATITEFPRMPNFWLVTSMSSIQVTKQRSFRHAVFLKFLLGSHVTRHRLQKVTEKTRQVVSSSPKCSILPLLPIHPPSRNSTTLPSKSKLRTHHAGLVRSLYCPSRPRSIGRTKSTAHPRCLSRQFNDLLRDILGPRRQSSRSRIVPAETSGIATPLGEFTVEGTSTGY